MFVEQLIKKGGMHDFRFLRGRGRFSLLHWLPPFSSLILFISYETLLSILQNSPPLSKQFTFKYFNNYFPKKGEIALHEIFKLSLRGAKLLK
jgi:hypothetical protein